MAFSFTSSIDCNKFKIEIDLQAKSKSFIIEVLNDELSNNSSGHFLISKFRRDTLLVLYKFLKTMDIHSLEL